MIVLDTNVISEIYRKAPQLAVRDWMNSQPEGTLWLCTPVLAELRYGFERLAEGARKTFLSITVRQLENEYYLGRILDFDLAAAAEYGRLLAKRERMGRPMKQMDALIAAIAMAHRAILATRDVHDFSDIGLTLIDPFQAP